MGVESMQRDGIRVFRIVGELTGETADELAAEALPVVTQPRSRIVIDLSACPFLNSAALSLLVDLTARANVQESRVVLAGIRTSVRGVLESTRLDRFFDCAADLDAALSELQ